MKLIDCQVGLCCKFIPADLLLNLRKELHLEHIMLWHSLSTKCLCSQHTQLQAGLASDKKPQCPRGFCACTMEWQPEQQSGFNQNLQKSCGSPHHLDSVHPIKSWNCHAHSGQDASACAKPFVPSSQSLRYSLTKVIKRNTSTMMNQQKKISTKNDPWGKPCSPGPRGTLVRVSYLCLMRMCNVAQLPTIHS